MVSVHGEAENEFIRRLLFIHYESHKWVWLSRSRNYNKTHGFLWADNTPLDYANWVAPDVDCNVCCEVSLMQSGHWYASNCNTWTFSQLCVRKLATTAANQPVQLGDNFYLSQFGASVDTKVPEIEPNITELVEWLAYEVESVREELHQLNDTNRILIDEYIYERDYYVHVLLSLTVTLLVIVVTLVILSYHMLLRKLDNMGSFCDK
ncbi:hypothetical protein HDE_05628 [Halotydeus destructor]|nr:hypothetical protein HDE_05628 [Halotydeus destructor]